MVTRAGFSKIANSRPLAGNIVYGIDPSLTGTGVAALALSPGGEIVAATALTITIPKQVDTIERIKYIVDTLEDALAVCGENTSCIAIEDLPVHANSAGLTGQAQGAVRYAISSTYTNKSPAVITVAPATLKKYVTGSGRADKTKMLSSVSEALNGIFSPEDDNQADALALALVAKGYIDSSLQDVSHKILRG